jgi:hypothetical protein
MPHIREVVKPKAKRGKSSVGKNVRDDHVFEMTMYSCL